MMSVPPVQAEPADAPWFDPADMPEWAGCFDLDEPEPELWTCTLCSHDVDEECGVSEKDYFVQGDALCICHDAEWNLE